MTPREISTRLYRYREKAGKHLGSGRYGSVYTFRRRTDKVFKIGQDSGDGWPHYILWAAREGFMGGLAPMVYYLRAFPDSSYIAIMERLKPTRCDDLGQELPKDTYMLARDLCAYASSRDRHHYIGALSKDNPYFKAALSSGLLFTDISPNNTMWRGNEPVFTDPVSHRYDMPKLWNVLPEPLRNFEGRKCIPGLLRGAPLSAPVLPPIPRPPMPRPRVCDEVPF